MSEWARKMNIILDVNRANNYSTLKIKKISFSKNKK